MLAVPEVVLEGTAELLHAEPDAGLDGTKGLVGEAGDFLLSEAAEVGEFEGAFLVAGEVAKRGADASAHLAEGGGGGGIIAGGGNLVDAWVVGAVIARGKFVAETTATGADLVDGAVAGDAHEPGDEAATLGDEGFGAAPEADEDVLGSVFGEGGIGEDAKGRGVDEVGVAVVEDTEGQFVAGGNGEHQGLVGPGEPDRQGVARWASKLARPGNATNGGWVWIALPRHRWSQWASYASSSLCQGSEAGLYRCFRRRGPVYAGLPGAGRNWAGRPKQELAMNGRITRLGAALVAIAALWVGAACSSSGGSGERDPAATGAVDSSPAGVIAGAARPAVRGDGEMTVAELVRAVEPSVVKITTSSGVGSGFVVAEDGYIMTNNHVIAGLSGRASSSIQATMSDGSEHRATVVGADARSDLALIKIDVKGLAPLKMAKLADVQVGQDVVAIGYALDLAGGDGPGFTVTRGIVSAKNRSTSEAGGALGAIQTDAAINHGNSGGPLLNLYGEVVGVNTSIAPDLATGGVAVGIGFAVGSDMVRAVYEELKENGKVNRGLLGIQAFEMLLPAKARELGVPVELGGVYLDTASDVPDGPAARAGMKAGDVIVAIGGLATRNEADLAVAMVKHRPGEKVDVDIYRGGKKMTLQVTLGTPAQ